MDLVRPDRPVRVDAGRGRELAADLVERLEVRGLADRAQVRGVRPAQGAGDRGLVVGGRGTHDGLRELVHGHPQRGPVAEHADVGHGLADAVRDGAHVFADDPGAGPAGLDAQDGEHGLRRVGDVGALAGGGARGDPEQPPQLHHVVDPQRAGVPERDPDHLDEQIEVGGGQSDRVEGRQTPLLTVDVVPVGRAAHLEVEADLVLVGPGVRAARVEPDRDVHHDVDAVARVAGRGELGVGHPLRPRVEPDAAGTARGERRVGVLVRLVPVLPVARAVGLGEHAPGREPGEVLTVLGDPGVVGDGQVVAGRDPDALEGGALERPDRVAVDLAHGVQGVASLSEVGQIDDVGPGGVADRDVQQLEPLARGGGVGGRLLLGDGCGGMHGRDQHRRRSGRLGRAGDRREVAEVADAPRRARARSVQLDGPAPAAGGLRKVGGRADHEPVAAVRGALVVVPGGRGDAERPLDEVPGEVAQRADELGVQLSGHADQRVLGGHPGADRSGEVNERLCRRGLDLAERVDIRGRDAQGCQHVRRGRDRADAAARVGATVVGC